jgi:type I restriction enzyme M protein
VFTGLPTYRLRGRSGASLPLINIGDLNHAYDANWRLANVQVPHPARMEPYRVRTNDIVVTARGTNLKIAMIPERWNGAVLAWNLLGIRPGAQLRPELLLAYLRSRAGRRAIDRRLAGTTLLLLTANGLGEIEVPILPLDQQQRVGQLIAAAEEQYEHALLAAEMRRDIAHKIALDTMTGKGNSGEDA